MNKNVTYRVSRDKTERQFISDKVTKLLNEDYKQQYEYFTEHDDYIGNYKDFPIESNYYNTTIYCDSVDFYDTREDAENKLLASLMTKYDFTTKEDLYHELYTHCDIRSEVNHGYYYKPSNIICFDSVHIEEEEIQFSDGDIFELLRQLTDKEIRHLDTEYYMRPYSTGCNYLAYMSLDVFFTFELDIDQAIIYLDSRELIQ